MSQEPAPGTLLCAVDSIPDGGARDLLLPGSDEPLRVVLFREGDEVHAYRNHCPHMHLPLNPRPDEFLMLGDGLVMCGWHSAVFRIADGACIDGPCAGEVLHPIAVARSGAMVVLARHP